MNRIPLLTGNQEMVVVADAHTLAQLHAFSIQGTYPRAEIGSLGFWGDDGGLYLGVRLEGSQNQAMSEVLSVRLGGSGLVRLTSNQAFDSQADGIPRSAIASCRACAGIPALPEGQPADSITAGGVVLEAATLASGSRSKVSVTDYCPHDAVPEVKVPWSQASGGGAAHARILFPAATFGEGAAAVQVTGCHYNALTLEAYDRNGAVLATATHGAGQGRLQTLTLGGGKIASIEVIGAEIGLRDVCWAP